MDGSAGTRCSKGSRGKLAELPALISLSALAAQPFESRRKFIFNVPGGGRFLFYIASINQDDFSCRAGTSGNICHEGLMSATCARAADGNLATRRRKFAPEPFSARHPTNNLFLLLLIYLISPPVHLWSESLNDCEVLSFFFFFT